MEARWRNRARTSTTPAWRHTAAVASRRQAGCGERPPPSATGTQCGTWAWMMRTQETSTGLSSGTTARSKLGASAPVSNSGTFTSSASSGISPDSHSALVPTPAIWTQCSGCRPSDTEEVTSATARNGSNERLNEDTCVPCWKLPVAPKRSTTWPRRLAGGNEQQTWEVSAHAATWRA